MFLRWHKGNDGIYALHDWQTNSMGQVKAVCTLVLHELFEGREAPYGRREKKGTETEELRLTSRPVNTLVLGTYLLLRCRKMKHGPTRLNEGWMTDSQHGHWRRLR